MENFRAIGDSFRQEAAFFQDMEFTDEDNFLWTVIQKGIKTMISNSSEIFNFLTYKIAFIINIIYIEIPTKRAQMDHVDMVILSGLLHFLTFADKDKPLTRLGQGLQLSCPEANHCGDDSELKFRRHFKT